ncbi:MAG: hypothetical protein FWH20_08000 [Oscillospiraceae bacterium]|nr:hypothetical protein [Oscillospiraceae bacterium]
MKSICKIILASILVLSLLAGFVACTEEESVTPAAGGTVESDPGPTPRTAEPTEPTEPGEPTEVDEPIEPDEPGEIDPDIDIDIDFDDLDLDDMFGDIFGGLDTESDITPEELVTMYAAMVDKLIDLAIRFEANPDKDAFAAEIEAVGTEVFSVSMMAIGVAMQLGADEDALEYLTEELQALAEKLEPYESIVEIMFEDVF